MNHTQDKWKVNKIDNMKDSYSDALYGDLEELPEGYRYCVVETI